jgi:hypothetical protein
MVSSRLMRIARVALPVLIPVALFPISLRLADPLFTHPFRIGWQYRYPVLLVWPDHIEIRWFRNVSEVSPRPKDAGYTFNVAPERQAWVESRVRNTPSSGDSSWIIHVKQLGPSRQRIQLEVLGSGITGIVYEAEPDQIVPLRSRLAGPLSSLLILAVDLLGCGGAWFLIMSVRRVFTTGAGASTRSVHSVGILS